MHLKIWSWWPCGALIEREKRPGLSGEYKDSKGGRETRFSLRREERGEETRGEGRTRGLLLLALGISVILHFCPCAAISIKCIFGPDHHCVCRSK
jgi:hypothetical protein